MTDLDTGTDFVNGNTADATAVNARFAAIETFINTTGVPKVQSVAGAVPIASLADPTTGKVIGSSGSAAAAVYPPGYELGYEEVTSNVTLVALGTNSGLTDVITFDPITFDGQPVMVEFYCSDIYGSGADPLYVHLYEGATGLGRMGLVTASSSATRNNPVICRYRFTPSAGSHTYKIVAENTDAGGTGLVRAGAGGSSSVYVPAYARITKV